MRRSVYLCACIALLSLLAVSSNAQQGDIAYQPVSDSNGRQRSGEQWG